MKDKDIEVIDKEMIEKGIREYTKAKEEIEKLCIDVKNCKFF